MSSSLISSSNLLIQSTVTRYSTKTSLRSALLQFLNLMFINLNTIIDVVYNFLLFLRVAHTWFTLHWFQVCLGWQSCLILMLLDYLFQLLVQLLGFLDLFCYLLLSSGFYHLFYLSDNTNYLLLSSIHTKRTTMNKQKTALITVGTTHFQGLIKSADADNFVKMLKNNGFTKIIYQIGRGHYQPTNGEHFRLTPHINEYYNKADLIITHGGAGTLLQNLLSGKLMIAVANQQLLGNHQIELIDKLVNEGYIIGFGSIKEFEDNMEKIQKFIKEGRRKQYKRPNQCIMNDIVFGKQKNS